MFFQKITKGVLLILTIWKNKRHRLRFKQFKQCLHQDHEEYDTALYLLAALERDFSDYISPEEGINWEGIMDVTKNLCGYQKTFVEVAANLYDWRAYEVDISKTFLSLDPFHKYLVIEAIRQRYIGNIFDIGDIYISKEREKYTVSYEQTTFEQVNKQFTCLHDALTYSENLKIHMVYPEVVLSKEVENEIDDDILPF